MVKLIVLAAVVLFATVCYAQGWDDLIDNLISSSKDYNGIPQIDKACIFGKDGSRRTTDNHANALKLTDSEVTTISTAFRNENYATLRSNGILIEGVIYRIYIETEQEVLARNNYDHGSVVLSASHSGIVIAHAPAPKVSYAARMATNALVEYLKNSGM